MMIDFTLTGENAVVGYESATNTYQVHSTGYDLTLEGLIQFSEEVSAFVKMIVGGSSENQ